MSRRTAHILGWVPALFVGFFALAALAADQAPVTTNKTPGGLSFRHAQLPEETHQVVSFGWRDGTAISRPEWSMVPVLARDLLREGPKGLSGSAFLEELDDLQASVSLTAAASLLSGRLSAPPEQLGDAAALLSRTLLEPSLPAAKLEQFKKSRTERSREALENPQTLASRLMARVVLGNNPHTAYLIDDHSQYEKVTMADIEAWHRDILARDNLIVATAGPMSAEEVAPLIDRMFARLPQKAKLPAIPRPVITAPGKLIVLEQPVPQTAIAAGDLTTVAVSPDYARADLARALIQGDTGAKTGLTMVIRERMGASYGVSASLSEADADTRALVITTLVANESAPAAVAALVAEYSRFFAEGFLSDELDAFMGIEAASAHELFQQAQSLADSLRVQVEYGFPDDYLATYEQRIRAYTAAEIAAEMVKTFPKSLTIVMVAPSAAGLKADCVIQKPEDITRCQ